MCVRLVYSCVNMLLTCCSTFFFFFKQKTAYEVRISDWSSDVCSSDLLDEKLVIALFAAFQPTGGTEGKPDAAIVTQGAPDFTPNRSPQPLPGEQPVGEDDPELKLGRTLSRPDFR